MKTIAHGVLLLLVMGVAAQTAWSASPCDNVDRSLTDKSKAALAPVIARQLRAKKVDVLQAFRFGGWTIIYVDSHNSDPPYLFYSHDPLHEHYVTLWSGAAAFFEEQEIKDWTRKNAPGIPAEAG